MDRMKIAENNLKKPPAGTGGGLGGLWMRAEGHLLREWA